MWSMYESGHVCSVHMDHYMYVARKRCFSSDLTHSYSRCLEKQEIECNTIKMMLLAQGTLVLAYLLTTSTMVDED